MNQELELLMLQAGRYMRQQYPATDGWEIRTNVDCGGAIADLAATRKLNGQLTAIPAMVVAGHWVTPIYGRILMKWKFGAERKEAEVPQLLLFARKGTIADQIRPEVTYVELEEERPLQKTG